MCLALRDELFDEDVGNAEGGPGLAPRLVERGVERVGRLDHAHAAAAAAHRRLDDDRIAERLGDRLGLLARHDRRSRCPRGPGCPPRAPACARPPCRPAGRAARAAARRTRCPPRRRRGRIRRSPTGSRSRDGSRRLPSPWPARRSPRCSDSCGSARRACRPRRPRRPSSDGWRTGLRANRSPRSGCPARAPTGRRGSRSRRDWRPSTCETRSCAKRSVRG